MAFSATLNGHLATSVRVTLPAWGAWYADVAIDGEHTLAGAATLKALDLTLVGTVLTGGPMTGRSACRIVGGAGGWGNTIARKAYANDAGVKIATVVRDAAELAGETVSLTTTEKTGPGFVRPEGPASRVLELVAASAWYVGEDGVTRLGRRTTSTLDAKVPRVTPVDLARGTVTLAPTSLAALLPGVTVDGLEAVDVLHEITPKGVRSTIWGARGSERSRRLEAYRLLLDQLDPDRAFRAVWEYRVVTQSGERLTLQPVRVSTGMPDLSSVPVRPGVSGARSTVALGSRVLVAFVDGSPSRPVVVGFEDAEGEGFTPILTEIDASTFVNLGAGALPVARLGDLAGIFPVVTTQVKVKA